MFRHKDQTGSMIPAPQIRKPGSIICSGGFILPCGFEVAGPFLFFHIWAFHSQVFSPATNSLIPLAILSLISIMELLCKFMWHSFIHVLLLTHFLRVCIHRWYLLSLPPRAGRVFTQFLVLCVLSTEFLGEETQDSYNGHIQIPNVHSFTNWRSPIIRFGQGSQKNCCLTHRLTESSVDFTSKPQGSSQAWRTFLDLPRNHWAVRAHPPPLESTVGSGYKDMCA